MTVRDPDTLRSGVQRASIDGIVDALRGLYTKDSTTGKPLLAGSMGRLELVQSQSATAATVDFTTGIVAGYDYEMDIEGLVLGTDGTAAWLRVSTDGGSTYKAGVSDYRWAFWAVADDGTSGAGADIADSEITLTAAFGNASGEHFDATVRIRSPGSTALHKRVMWHGAYATTVGLEVSVTGSGRYLATTAINGIRIMSSDGVAFSAGTITLRRKWRS